ncbi:hypothetical protein [Paenibacillus sp. TH7-28]
MSVERGLGPLEIAGLQPAAATMKTIPPLAAEMTKLPAVSLWNDDGGPSPAVPLKIAEIYVLIIRSRQVDPT